MTMRKSIKDVIVPMAETTARLDECGLKTTVDVYLDYFNNFTTHEGMASFYGVDAECLLMIIEHGRFDYETELEEKNN